MRPGPAGPKGHWQGPAGPKGHWQGPAGPRGRWQGPAVLAGGGLLAAGAAAGYLLPAATTWRFLRCWATPDLAGIGHPGHLALTFDDGPDPKSTPAFLDELDRLGWQATFFLLGPMVRRAPSLAAELTARGHEVGVHGEQHRSHLRRTPGDIRDDLTRARDTIASATGTEPVWFRPPYGALSSGSLSAARRLGLRTVLWTTWGRDWRAEATPATVVADVTGGLRPGATVLLHDSDCTSAPGSWRSALGALEPLSDTFAARGLTVGPLARHGLLDRDGLLGGHGLLGRDGLLGRNGLLSRNGLRAA